MNTPRKIWVLGLVVLFTFLTPTSDADEIKRYKVRFGTLEVKSRIYTFQSGEFTETFDRTVATNLARESKPDPDTYRRGPSDLLEFGIRLVDGKLLELSETSKEKLLELLNAQKIVALIFEDPDGGRLELKVEGKTQVVRVDVEFGDNQKSQTKTIWSNLPTEK